MLGTAVDKKIDEPADLGRQMVTMRIDSVQREFHRPVVGQQANKAARFQIVSDQEPRRQTDAEALKRRLSQRLAAVGDQIARDPRDGRGTFAVDKMPSILKRIKRVSDAIAV